MILSATAPSIGLALMITALLPAQVSLAGDGSGREATCDTVYVGPPGAPWQLESNWSNGIPGPDTAPCFPSHAGTVGSLLQEDTAPSAVTVAYARPASPTATGSCCLGSSCMETDAFDCRELGGHFLEGVGPCTQFVCDTGVCCKQNPECVDDDGFGGDMDEALCHTVGGDYLGGAACTEDPCQRYRIPLGFEIIEAAPGTETLEHGVPRINNCGQIVFHMGPRGLGDRETEVHLYENGEVIQVTDDPLVSNVYPDINDDGTIVWVRGREGSGTGSIVLLEDGGSEVQVSGGSAPSVNDLGHVAWKVVTPEGCDLSEFKSDIYFYDGRTVEKIFDDGFSNQSPEINEHEQMVWERAHFPCGGGFGDWTSEIMLYTHGVATPLPAAVDTPQLPDLDNIGRAAWGSFRLVEVWEDGVTTQLTDGHIPALNDRGQIAYQFKTTFTPWQIWLYDDGAFRRISSDLDIENHTDNIRPDLNDAGEIGWWWHPNGQLIPSGIRYMRRIRDGDVDFDGDVDIDDFIPLPECFTGAVPTDRLCECRFFDIDHDRDIDNDDYDLFMRVYTGPMEDCNENSTLDLIDLIEGAAFDCNLNGRPDTCDIDSGFSEDIDGNGVPDECWGVIPTVSQWGLLAMTLLLTAAATVILQRAQRRRPSATGQQV
jgi:hypothetical protein